MRRCSSSQRCWRGRARRTAEAVLSGTIADSRAASCGRDGTAVHEATGNRFESVTDERGAYRIPRALAWYQITAELPGFNRDSSPLATLVGQTIVVNLQMFRPQCKETVPSRPSAPLNVATSSLRRQLDPQQVQELPVSGTQLDVARDARAGQPYDEPRPTTRRLPTVAPRATSGSTSSTSTASR